MTAERDGLTTPRILGSDAARAVGRFRPDGPLGYRAKSAPDAPLRATRAEAEADERAHLDQETPMTLPTYVYVASSWRNPMQQMVVETLRAASIDCYDFRNPEGGTGFSWSQVKTDVPSSDVTLCAHCNQQIKRSSFTGLGFYEPDVDPDNDPVVWRHVRNGYGSCGDLKNNAIPKKGSDWEDAAEYLRMLDHPRAQAGFEADFAAMQKADTFVMVLPCGKSAHLELGWATGAGKRTAILLENPVEPELMYLCADYRARNVMDLLGWLGVED